MVVLAAWGCSADATPPAGHGIKPVVGARPALDAGQAVARVQAEMQRRDLAKRYFISHVQLITATAQPHWEVTLKASNPLLEVQPAFKVQMDGQLELVPGR